MYSVLTCRHQYNGPEAHLVISQVDLVTQQPAHSLQLLLIGLAGYHLLHRVQQPRQTACSQPNSTSAYQNLAVANNSTRLSGQPNSSLTEQECM